MLKQGFLIGVFLLLMGCVDVAMTGAQVVYNRHSIEENLSDQYITHQLYQALHIRTESFRNANISIATYHGNVLLTGQVPFGWQRTKVDEIAKGISGIRSIYNCITINPPTSNWIRINDAWLTTKVKARLLASSDVDASKIKVVTENGSVYLMGTVTKNEAEAASALASSTDGVRKVIKVFSYIQIVKA